MITLYQTNSWSNRIEPIKVVKVTDKTVLLTSGRREARLSDHQAYHDTIEAAKHYLISRCERSVENAKRRLREAELELQECKKELA